MYIFEKLLTIIQGIVVFVMLNLGYQVLPESDSVISNEATSSAQLQQSNETAISSNSKDGQLGTTKAQTPAGDTARHYVMEDHPSGEAGFYVLKNTPDEPMTTQDELNSAVNQYRSAHGLNVLAIDPQLCDIANQRASEATNHFSHQGFQEHIQAGDYNYTGFQTIGENLWQGSFSGVHIVEFGWDRSLGHRANLQGDWTRGCAGIQHTTVAFVFAR